MSALAAGKCVPLKDFAEALAFTDKIGAASSRSQTYRRPTVGPTRQSLAVRLPVSPTCPTRQSLAVRLPDTIL